MGTAKSTMSRAQGGPVGDVITTVSERVEGADPVLEKLRSLRLTPPILQFPLAEGSLSDILVKKSPSSGAQGTIDPKVLVELFSLYWDWHADMVQKITKKQEAVENKVELADALAVKLLQRLNDSLSTMKTTAHRLSEVHKLQVELGELKGRLTEVISNCDAICKRITSEGPESLHESAAPLAAAVARISSVDNGELLAKTSPSDNTGLD
ncbi:hypothetical protein MLD38_007803 [Melastoma candidum]|uniref:Uncharacterized protein n=1 Tax=Melastoma candidum TaxID=119954 RepID=A0ACB9RTL4_9MYRT|nr:hypothetical protein MLD38_007803 [Melastoma candidum]